MARATTNQGENKMFKTGDKVTDGNSEGIVTKVTGAVCLTGTKYWVFVEFDKGYSMNCRPVELTAI
jgi:hypothetical protein